ncbi:MAG: hypothetical protein KF744_14515 [Taibaiella sp.]|nr:hypothetical protein [Taibaiella sp.]
MFSRKVKMMLVATIAISVLATSCKKKDDASSSSSTSTNAGSKLRILTGSSGQNQTMSANIDNDGYVNFDAQTVLADGGSPLHQYTWSFDNTSTVPAGITIGSATGVITRNGTSSTGLTTGTKKLTVKVSDGSSTATGTIELKVTNYTPGPAALLQQLSSPFTLVNGVANKAYGASLFVTGGKPPYTWLLDDTYAGSADLTNAGLTVEGASGVVTGTIMPSASGKTIKFKVIVKDATGETAIYAPVYTIVVN